MNFLITGGAGFIGSNFLHLMTKKYSSDNYVCLDALTYAGNLETLEPIMKLKNFKFIKGDIRDRKLVFNLFKKERFDIVINFAVESHVDRSIDNPQIFLETNIIGTSILMDACREYKVKRFHQVSTDEVYGDLPLDRPDLLFSEESPLHTSSPYSSSKASADLLVMAYFRTYKLPVTISRCSNNYGPYQFPEKLIPLMIQKALKNDKLPIYGDGLNVRDWLHVYDHCDAIDLIVRKSKEGEIYNIGGNNEKSNIEIVKTILKELNKDESLILYIKDRPGHDRRYAIDATKLRKDLGWLPMYKFDEGLKQTIKWNIDSDSWIKNVESGKYLKETKRYE